MEQKKIKLSGILFFAAIAAYILNVGGILLTVILNSFSKGWYSGFLPKTYTTEWYKYAANDHDIGNLLWVTTIVVVAVIFISLVISLPAAYVMARHDFRFKRIILTLFMLPMLIPPMTYGVPLASVLYKVKLAPKISGVILANLVPIVPFMILLLVPFIEQVGENLESAAKMLGASRTQTFFRILMPLTKPGILTSIILSVTKTISMFELSFLVAGGKSQTLIVALFSDAYATGARPFQAIDALAVIYFLISLVFLMISLKFVSPTQMVFKVK
ncbi:MAG: ABC transporter permease subunit [Clostridiaceae bacterium]